jgi:acyl-coenzyme A synthetase/AMP-(fatty) acid ligase
MNYNLYALFEKIAITVPDKIAIQEVSGKRISYEELYKQIESCSAILSQKKIMKGTKVIFANKMSIEFYVYLISLVKLGATIIIIEPWLKKKHIDKAIESIKPEVFVGNIKYLVLFYMISSTFRKIKNKILCLKPTCNFNNKVETAITKQTDITFITFTTGSTGVSKGIIRTHGLLMKQLEIISNIQNYVENEVEMQLYPIFLLANLGRGITSIIPWLKIQDVQKADYKQLADNIRNNNISAITSSPRFIKCLLQYKDKLASLKKIYIGGGTVTQELIDEVKNICPEAQVYTIYGSTEAEPISKLEANHSDNRILDSGFCVGKPVKEIQVKIESDGYVELGGYYTGEILVSGEHVCRSYFDIKEGCVIHKKADINNTIWHATGDIGYLDNEGNLWFCGRITNVLILNNKKIPSEIIEFKIKRNIEMSNLAVLQHMGRIFVITEKMKKSNYLASIKDILSDYNIVEYTNIYVKKIPTDPRHRSKIDYNRLRGLLKKYV